jgi:hypothetical protein
MLVQAGTIPTLPRLNGGVQTEAEMVRYYPADTTGVVV